VLSFKPFYNDWLDCSQVFESDCQNNKPAILTTNLPNEFYQSLKFDNNSLKSYRIDTVYKLAEMLGDKPALTFSGGVDSQCMLQAWNESKLDFKVYTLVFKNDLNIQDVNHARKYCKVNNIELNEIEIDVVNFLTRENYDYGIKYNSASPHFNTHYKMYDILIDMGHTGICSGGNPIVRNQNDYGVAFTRNTLNFINYAKINNFPCQGSFLSFTPELAWAICLLTTDINVDTEFVKTKLGKTDQQTRDDIDTQIYQTKLKGYQSSGFNIIPQDKKYTGFELVKKYFQELTGDGWEFERRFRHPLENTIKPSHWCKLKLDDNSLHTIKSIYTNNLRPSN